MRIKVIVERKKKKKDPVGKEIGKQMDKGKDRDQAVAIALSMEEEGTLEEGFIDAIVNRKTHKIGKEAIAQLQGYASDPIGNINTINSIYDELTQIEKENSPAADSLYDALELARELISKQYSNRQSDTGSTKSYDGYDIDSPEAVKARGDKRRRLAQYKQDQERERRDQIQRAKDNVRRGFDAGLVDYADTLKEIVKEELEVVLEEKGKRGDVPPSYDHVVKMAKEEGISEKEALMRLTTKLEPEEADGWLKRQKEKIAKGEQPLEEKKKRKKRKKKKKKKGKKDACYHKVRARYDVWPSAYASGALVKCRKVGAKNWGNKSKKKTNEDLEKELELDSEFLQEVDELLNLDEKKKKKRKKKKGSKLTSKPSSEKSLHQWFSRKGAKGKKKGWVDCNAPDGKGGYKSCGRSDGEKRKKYPACRPTPGACKKMKGSKGKSWGKKGSKKK